MSYEVITDQHKTVSVGERIRLTPAFIDGTYGNFVSVKWTIDGMYISGYNGDQQTRVKVRPFRENDKDKRLLEFYWINKGEGLKVKAETTYTKGKRTVQATYDVKRPRFDYLNVEVDRVGIRTALFGSPLPKLVFGMTKRVLSNFTSDVYPGFRVWWRATLDGANDGLIQDVQLVIDHRRMAAAGGKSWVRRYRGASPGEELLDNTNPYATGSMPVYGDRPMPRPAPWSFSSSGSAYHDGVVDEPSSPLSRPGHLYEGPGGRPIDMISRSIDDKFRYFLMYQSCKEGSLWIPIAEVKWWFKGKAVRDPGTTDPWRLEDADWERSPPIRMNRFIELPEWRERASTETDSWQPG